jgi:hypothetical protein
MFIKLVYVWFHHIVPIRVIIFLNRGENFVNFHFFIAIVRERGNFIFCAMNERDVISYCCNGCANRVVFLFTFFAIVVLKVFTPHSFDVSTYVFTESRFRRISECYRGCLRVASNIVPWMHA